MTPSPSFRRRPESSGLDNLFPPGGNDCLWCIPARPTITNPLTSRLALLGSLFQMPFYHLGRLFPQKRDMYVVNDNRSY